MKSVLCVIWASTTTYSGKRFLTKMSECIGSYPVADLEGVPWVPWNPSVEGLPSNILSTNILRTPQSYAEATLL